MLGIHLVVASHKLNVSSTSWLIWKKIRRFHPNRQKIIQIKIDKLLAIRFIKEVKYLNWLANVMEGGESMLITPTWMTFA